MNVFPFLRPHKKWAELADAYADGELAAAEAERFEAHSATCGPCAQSLKAARALKSAISVLPELQAPRSFRLTPAMVAVNAPVKAQRPRRAPTPILRFAQVGAAAAVIALGAVTLADFVGGSGGADQAAPGGTLESTNEKGMEAVDAVAPLQATLAASTPAPTLPPPVTRGASAAGVEPTPTSPASYMPPETPPQAPLTGAGDDPNSETARTIGDAEPPGDTYAIEAPQPAAGAGGDSGGIPAIRFVEIGLGALTLASIGLLLWGRGKRGNA
jgi:Putative zinc-finger